MVITSVDRDDLADGGAEHYARVVRRVKELKPSMRLECLTPDFNNTSGLAGVATVATAGLDVYAHNTLTLALALALALALTQAGRSTPRGWCAA